MATLFDVKGYLSERGKAPLTDIALRFDTSVDAARALVDVWIAKNRVRRVDIDATEHMDCGAKACAKASCCSGNPQNLEVYEWIERSP
ncbi:putative ferrous iron transport protein C [Azospirillaceae bacterium]